MIPMKVAKLKEIYRVNKLALEEKKKELHYRLKAKLNNRVKLNVKYLEQAIL